MAAKAAALDFTNVKDGGGSFSKKHMPEGDYLAKVTKVEDAISKKDEGSMWLFTIQLAETPSATYPYYCKLQENQLWKVRNLCVAAGINVPKQRIKVDPNKLTGKTIAVSLEDEEYEGKMQSVIGSIFPPSELEASAGVEPDDDEDDDTPPPPKKAKKSKAPAPADDDDEDDVPAPKAKKKKKKNTAEADDELDIDEL